MTKKFIFAVDDKGGEIGKQGTIIHRHLSHFADSADDITGLLQYLEAGPFVDVLIAV